MGIRFKRTTPDSWNSPVIHKDKVSKEYRKLAGRIMFPTTHDITPANIHAVCTVLHKLLISGNEVLVVSKPHLECVKVICEDFQQYRDNILFRFTVGSADDAVLKFWEPNAPSFRERLRALKWAYTHGFKTSVSSEPMLDGKIDIVVTAVKPYVTDAVWLGRVNQLGNAISMNCPGDKQARKRADELLGLQNDEWIWGVYDRYRRDSFIKWKDSIKKVIGLPRPDKKGLDV